MKVPLPNNLPLDLDTPTLTAGNGICLCASEFTTELICHSLVRTGGRVEWHVVLA